jgi:AraC-like DNA-binding protein
LRQLLENAKSGIAFGMATIMKVYSKLDEMTQTQPGFQRVMKFLEILYILSMAKDVKMLSSESFSNCKINSDSRRVRKVEEYITENYHKVITLNQLSSIAGMTPTAFSRFFKLRTGRTITDYIIDLRLGYAARQLIDSTTSIVEICYECGFNNVSNFNRIFKRKKGCSPKAFRDNFRKNRVIV